MITKYNNSHPINMVDRMNMLYEQIYYIYMVMIVVK